MCLLYFHTLETFMLPVLTLGWLLGDILRPWGVAHRSVVLGPLRYPTDADTSLTTLNCSQLRYHYNVKDSAFVYSLIVSYLFSASD